MAEHFEDDDEWHTHSHYIPEPTQDSQFAFPPLDHRREDSLNNEFLMIAFDAVAGQWRMRGVTEQDITEGRKQLYAAIDTPSSSTWDAVHQFRIWKQGTKDPLYLWSLVLEHTRYDVAEHVPGTRWRKVPGGAQIMLAISMHLSVPRAPDITF